MDGFALRAGDIALASPEHPVRLALAGTIFAGAASGGAVSPGSALRIMTGAPVPAGADAVVPHELTRTEGEAVVFEAPSEPGTHVRRSGSDLRPGDAPLRAGIRLTGPRLALAAVLGRDRLLVTRRPRIGILSAGDELVEPEAAPAPGQVRSVNAFSLIGLISELGAEPVDLGIVRDSIEAVRAAIGRAGAAGLDLVVSTGGASAGDRDCIRDLALADGRPGRILKAAMRPGKPLVAARIKGLPLLGLPGNPGSAVVSFAVFGRPAVRRLLGEVPEIAGRFKVRLEIPVRYRPGRTHVLRARAEPDPEGGFRVVEAGGQDAGGLASLARANILVFLPGDRDGAAAGELHPAEWLRG
jgi:molybdopterin molybdotransferase